MNILYSLPYCCLLFFHSLGMILVTTVAYERLRARRDTPSARYCGATEPILGLTIPE